MSYQMLNNSFLLVLLRQLTPCAEQMSILEHDEWNQTQDCSEHGKDETCVLTAHVVEECARKKWRNSTKGVPHQSLTSDSRR